jgi:hypothetical protein
MNGSGVVAPSGLSRHAYHRYFHDPREGRGDRRCHRCFRDECGCRDGSLVGFAAVNTTTFARMNVGLLAHIHKNRDAARRRAPGLGFADQPGGLVVTPSPASAARAWPAPVKRTLRMPSASAPVTFSGRSSRNTTSAGLALSRARTAW